MLFQAHRGVSTEYPENTMPAFRAAYEQGYQVIELDPAFTADDQCVVFHDLTVNRTCRNMDGSPIEAETPLAELTYKQLLMLDAGLFMGEQFRGTKVPLLSEVLAFAAETKQLVKLDSKFERRFSEEQLEMFFDIVDRSGARVAFTSKLPEMVQRVVARFPDAEIHYEGVADEESVLLFKSLLKDNPYTVWVAMPSHLTAWVKLPMATPELCAMVKRHAKLGLWILETQDQLQKAVLLGADIIETTGSIKPQ